MSTWITFVKTEETAQEVETKKATLHQLHYTILKIKKKIGIVEWRIGAQDL